MQSLRSAIASAIGPNSSKRSVNLVYDTAKTSRDLDPLGHALYLRVAGLRRMLVKHPGLLGRICLITRKYKHYIKANHPKRGGESSFTLWDLFKDEDVPPPLINDDVYIYPN